VRFFPIPGDRVFPEGITEGPGTTFFVGSMTDGTLYRGDTRTGAVEVFLPADGDGRGNICGLDVDGYGRLVSCDFASGQLFVHDIATRSLIARRRLPAETARPNDVVVHGDAAYVTDSHRPVVWRLPTGPEVGEPEIAVDLAPAGAAEEAFLNGIVCHPNRPLLLVSAQGEGAGLWRVDPADGSASLVDLNGYEFNADGMLLNGGTLYGLTNRGETHEDVRFLLSAARLAPDWRSGAIVGELSEETWDSPTTIASVGGELLVVCAQLAAMRTGTPPALPFVVAASDFPRWE
jgi:sugar lactone lactonase YvrE